MLSAVVFVCNGSSCSGGNCPTSGNFVCVDNEDCTMDCGNNGRCATVTVYAPANANLTITCRGNGGSCDGMTVEGQDSTDSIIVKCTNVEACSTSAGVTINSNGARYVYFSCDSENCAGPFYFHALASERLVIEALDASNTNRINNATIICPNDNFNNIARDGYPCEFYSESTTTGTGSSHTLTIFALEGFAKDLTMTCDQATDCFSSSSLLHCSNTPANNYCTIVQSGSGKEGECTNQVGTFSCQDDVVYTTPAPTSVPSNQPTIEPTAPTLAPSSMPTADTESPTFRPTAIPTKLPSNTPTDNPSALPTNTPTKSPTANPTNRPTAPTNTPTMNPSQIPTDSPSAIPSSIPTNIPTQIPSDIPTNNPSRTPTAEPTNNPTKIPTNIPSIIPTNNPSQTPTHMPSFNPSNSPTNIPSITPSSIPTHMPVIPPTRMPSSVPTIVPSIEPTGVTNEPTKMPSNDNNSGQTTSGDNSEDDVWS